MHQILVAFFLKDWSCLDSGRAGRMVDGRMGFRGACCRKLGQLESERKRGNQSAVFALHVTGHVDEDKHE